MFVRIMMIFGLSIILIAVVFFWPKEKTILSKIDLGKKYLIEAVLNDAYHLTCESNVMRPCPLENTGKIFSSFFILNAFKENTLPPDIAAIIENTILSEQRNNLWGYSTYAPLDSDDTSFALQSLILLKNTPSTDALDQFYVPSSNSYATFLMSPYFNNTSLEVNANIYYLFALLNQHKKINYHLITSMQNEDGSWPTSFYPNVYYSTYKSMKLLCLSNSFPQSIKKGINYIIRNQHTDGSWGDAYSTALALNTLFACHDTNEENIKKGIHYLLKEQTDKGYWNTKYAIWTYIYKEYPKEIWDAYDTQHVITTSLALQALSEYSSKQNLRK